MKKVLTALISGILILLSATPCFAENTPNSFDDTSLPNLNDGRWYETMHTDFTQIKNMDELNAQGWIPSPHGFRKYEYWCDQMIEFTDEGLIIHSEKKNDHQCDVCKVTDGIFTSGIETRKNVDGESVMTFSQAFGYFEATVIVPRGSGMWSAFWLQSNQCGQVGNKGEDGSEIDIFESSFMKNNPTKTGQAIHYDAYDPPFYRCGDNVTDTGKNLYDGEEHTYALKWTPTQYVMYVDGEVVWNTNYGGVSKTPEFLRLTTEIRDSGTGPYGQKIGQFENRDDGANDFIIKEVKVYQNSDFESHIKSPDDFKDMKKTYTTIFIVSCVIGGIVILAVAAVIIKVVVKKVKRKKIQES